MTQSYIATMPESRIVIFSIKVLRKALAESTYSIAIEKNQHRFMYYTHHINH